MTKERLVEWPPLRVASRLPETQRTPRLAQGTGERSRAEVRGMIAAAAETRSSLFDSDPIGDRPRMARSVANLQLTEQEDESECVDEHEHLTTPVSEFDSGLDQVINSILDSAAEPGETIDGHHQRKERALASLLRDLPVDAARCLYRRLASPRDDDPVAARFLRLIAERRERLLQLPADTPRRRAVQHTRR